MAAPSPSTMLCAAAAASISPNMNDSPMRDSSDSKTEPGHRSIGLALLDRTPTAPSIREGYAQAVARCGLEPAPMASLPKDDGGATPDRGEKPLHPGAATGPPSEDAPGHKGGKKGGVRPPAADPARRQENRRLDEESPCPHRSPAAAPSWPPLWPALRWQRSPPPPRTPTTRNRSPPSPPASPGGTPPARPSRRTAA